ncbi:MAG TPA: hypothetical protein PLL18_09630 [Flavobacteriales bacterium]|nr:hypothetical protein [Flavobacteriales bacterium]
MKKIIVYILILIPIISFSQSWTIPNIDWQEKTETENNYIDLLKLKDRNSLIIKIGYSSYWTKGQNSEFIVYQNDGKIKRFIVHQPNSTELKTKIKRRRISKKEFGHYWNHLNEIIQGKKYIIDKSKLNITSKSNGDGTSSVISVSDGANYSFWMYQGKNYLVYGSYSPLSFIESKFPGWKERQKLVELMNGFEKLTKEY